MACRTDFHRWTEFEEHRALILHAEGLGFDDIGADLGIPRGAVKARIEKLNATGNVRCNPHPNGYIAPQLIAERDARKAAYDLRDYTAEFCGDPPRGYSMLDKRGGVT
jgi:biotin operon repressor